MSSKKRKTISQKDFRKALADARKNPNFMKEMKAFIKATTTPYSLK